MTGGKNNKRKLAAGGDGKGRGDRRSAEGDRRSADGDRRRDDREDKGGGDHRPSVFSRLGNKVVVIFLSYPPPPPNIYIYIRF